MSTRVAFEAVARLSKHWYSCEGKNAHGASPVSPLKSRLNRLLHGDRMPWRFRFALLLAILSLLAQARGETVPPVEQVARRAVLILKCQAEIRNGKINYRVLESWKGRYRRELFYEQPQAGYLYRAGFDAKGRSDVQDGQEVIFIYSNNAVSSEAEHQGQILAHRADSILPSVRGKVIWVRGELDTTVYTLEELKAAIAAAMKEPASPKPKRIETKAQ
jgi:hypothetical protein